MQKEFFIDKFIKQVKIIQRPEEYLSFLIIYIRPIHTKEDDTPNEENKTISKESFTFQQFKTTLDSMVKKEPNEYERKVSLETDVIPVFPKRR